MKKLLIIIILIIFQNFNGYTQCIQSKPNSLFSTSNFLSFVRGVEKGEEKLLSWDFCLEETSKSNDGEVTYYSYRIDHTLNKNTGKHDFDVFAITNDVQRFSYLTNSNKNFITYKNKLVNSGFEKITEDSYIKKINGELFTMSIERSVHNSGTPNYKIHIAVFD